MKNIGKWSKRVLLALLLIVPVISAGWVGDSLQDVVRMQSAWPQGASCCWLGWVGWLESLIFSPWTHETHVRLAGVLGGLVLFVVSSLGFYHFRRTLLTSHARLLSDVTPEGRTVLILGLSQRNRSKDPKENDKIEAAFQAMATLPIEVTAAERRKGDLRVDEGRPNWQQAFRVVWDHVNAAARRQSFRAVLIVTSPESDPQMGEFVALLNDRLTDAVQRGVIAASAIPTIERVVSGGVKFDRYDDVVATLDRAVVGAKKRYQARHDQICVDVTAGTKTFSIAAAVVTLNRKLIFSYVDNDGKPLYFDAGIEIGAALGEG